MKLIISSLYFYPDHSGIALYSSDFAFFAAEQGHEVHVITGFPFYPAWKKRKEDRWKLFRSEKISNVNVHRVYTFVPNSPSTLKRLFQEFGVFFFSCFKYLQIGKPDCIVVFTTPVSFGYLGAIFKKMFKSKLLINVQDFQVEAASSLQMVRGSTFINLLKKLETYSYSNSNYVSSISESMCEVLERKVKEKEKVFLWPNWINLSGLVKPTIFGNFRRKYEIATDKVLVTYAGNIGLKQGLTVLVDVANEMKANDKLLFLIIGEGAGLEELQRYSSEKSLHNLRFLPFLSPSGYQDFLYDTDILFISQQKTEADIYFPSKLLGIMAKGKPILLSADTNSELYKVLDQNELAMTSDYGDVEKICSHINQFQKTPQLSNKLKLNCEDFVKQFDKKVVLDEVLKLIER